MVESCFILFFPFSLFFDGKDVSSTHAVLHHFSLSQILSEILCWTFYLHLFFCSVRKCSDTRSLVFDVDHKNCIDPSSFAGYCTMCEKDLYIHVCCIHIFISKSNCIYRYKVYSFTSLCFKLFV